MIRAIRIRLYPTPDQKKYLAGLFGAVRFCYNKALYLKTHFYKVKGVNLHPIHDLKKLIAIAKKSKNTPGWRNTTAWHCRNQFAI